MFVTDIKSKEDLQDLAQKILLEQTALINKSGDLKPGFFVASTPGELQFFGFGELSNMLNSGRSKTFLFATARIWVEACNANLFVLVTEGWKFIPNEKGTALDFETLRSKSDQGYATLIKEGYGDKKEVLSVMCQTPLFAAVASQAFDSLPLPGGNREMDLYGKPECESIDMANFSGRSKMFGDFGDDGVQFFYNRIKADPDAMEKLKETIGEKTL